MTTPPSRATTAGSLASESAIPDIDPNSTAGLLSDRLAAWKSVVTYLEEYMAAIEKAHKNQAKEYERALKVVSGPLKHGDNFDQSLGGIAGFFENVRANTQALVTTSAETEKSIKGSVLPALERLHKEIKHKGKELSHGAHKAAKEVERARNSTQRHIEMLGQQTAAFESAGAKMSGHDDPYVVRRGVMHRLHRQVVEENNHHNDLVAIQTSFEQFETHIVAAVQQAMEAFTQLAAGQADRTRALNSDMLHCVQKIPPGFEWARFVQRSGDRLVDPASPARAADAVAFANMEHASTRPLIEGSLERKSRNKLSWAHHAAYYVVTPARFLHEFRDEDDARHEPKPELSIYLPDAHVGAPHMDRFTVRGKDISKTVSSKLTGSSELVFKAHTATDAERWFEVIRSVAGATGPAEPGSPTSPTSPTSLTSPVSLTSPTDDAAPVSPVTSAGDDSHVTHEGGAADEKDTKDVRDAKGGGVGPDVAAPTAAPAAAPAAAPSAAPVAVAGGEKTQLEA